MSDLVRTDNIVSIEVAYWISPLPNLPFKHREKFKYSVEKRNEIIDTIINAGYNVMIKTYVPSIGEGFQIIWIDKYGFQQR